MTNTFSEAFSRRNLVKGASFAAVLGVGVSGARETQVFADEVDKKREEKKSIDDQLNSIRSDLTEVNQELSNAYLALAETELKIPDAQTRLDEARAAVEKARKEDEALAGRLRSAEAEEQSLLAQINQAKTQIDRSNEEVSRASIQAYKGSGMPNAATIYLGAENPQDAVDRTMNYRLTLESQGAQLSSLRTSQSINVNAADRLTAVREEISDLKAKSAELVKEREAAEADALAAKTALDDLYASQKSQTEELEALKSKYRDSETSLSAQSNALNKEIQQIMERNKLAASTKVVTDGSAFIHPVQGARISSPFGYRIHPIFHTRKLHAGQDYAIACGTPIRATADGTVVFAAYSGGGGNVIAIDHGVYDGQQMISRYLHQTRFEARLGQRVKQGEVIGYVGTTGNSTGCHLHFEIRLNGTPHDPRKFTG